MTAARRSDRRHGGTAGPSASSHQTGPHPDDRDAGPAVRRQRRPGLRRHRTWQLVATPYRSDRLSDLRHRCLGTPATAPSPRYPQHRPRHRHHPADHRRRSLRDGNPTSAPLPPQFNRHCLGHESPFPSLMVIRGMNRPVDAAGRDGPVDNAGYRAGPARHVARVTQWPKPNLPRINPDEPPQPPMS